MTAPIQCVSAAASATVVTAVVAASAAAEAASAAANEYENEDKDPSTAVTAKAIIVTHIKDLLFCLHHILCGFGALCYRVIFKKTFDFS